MAITMTKPGELGQNYIGQCELCGAEYTAHIDDIKGLPLFNSVWPKGESIIFIKAPCEYCERPNCVKFMPE